MPQRKKPSNEGIKALAEALKTGGTLLNQACPVCNTPLIKIDDKIFCKTCQREVIIYKNEEELPPNLRDSLIKEKKPQKQKKHDKVTKTIENKIEKLRETLEQTDDPDEIIKLSNAIDRLVESLEKIELKNG
ncbi:MAG: Sjogren's syndrome/scleroderma autoantigen 1 family protein [Asgard group archaeon]|nr:Sjogren's syndrome/scleroderma autoantigen 1 family protein [Asgard group archaeon]